MKLNFKSKFKDKIRFIHKSGVKETLLAKRPHERVDESLYNPETLQNKKYDSSLSPRRCRTYGVANQQYIDQMDREKTVKMKKNFSFVPESEPVTPLLPNKLSRKTSLTKKWNLYETIGTQKSKFIDEMLTKHENIIRMIDYKTKWKEKNDRKQFFREQTFFKERKHLDQVEDMSGKNRIKKEAVEVRLSPARNQKKVQIKFL